MGWRPGDKDHVQELQARGRAVATVWGLSYGWGFGVTNEHGRPVVSLTYSTEAEAKEARDLMVKVIIGAEFIPGSPPPGM